jgi:lysozyme
MIDNLLDQLKRDEGCILRVYRDTKGILTAGVGHNCEAHGENLVEGQSISQEQADTWLQQDIQTAKNTLFSKLPWVVNLDFIRQSVLINMCFNMGINGLIQFHQTLQAIASGNYTLAAERMLQSTWASQVGARAKRLATQMSLGIWQ